MACLPVIITSGLGARPGQHFAFIAILPAWVGSPHDVWPRIVFRQLQGGQQWILNASCMVGPRVWALCLLID